MLEPLGRPPGNRTTGIPRCGGYAYVLTVGGPHFPTAHIRRRRCHHGGLALSPANETTLGLWGKHRQGRYCHDNHPVKGFVSLLHSIPSASTGVMLFGLDAYPLCSDPHSYFHPLAFRACLLGFSTHIHMRQSGPPSVLSKLATIFSCMHDWQAIEGGHNKLTNQRNPLRVGLAHRVVNRK